MFDPKKILILGANGFLGTELCSYLEKHRLEIVRVDRSGSVDAFVDALDPDQVFKLVKKYEPDCIFNMIGYTDGRNPELIYKLNVLPFIHLAESIIKLNLRSRVILISSAAEYGESTDNRFSVKESDTKTPISLYGVSKLTQTHVAHIYHNLYNLDVIIGMPFNIIGNNMSPRLVPACFVHQFLQLFDEKNAIEIKTGNLASIRDFLHVEDMVSAIFKIAVSGKSGESYNICSGVGVSIRDIVDLVAKKLSLQYYKIVEEKSSSTKNGIRYSVGDNSKLKMLGWKPKQKLDKTICQLIFTIQKVASKAI